MKMVDICWGGRYRCVFVCLQFLVFQIFFFCEWGVGIQGGYSWCLVLFFIFVCCLGLFLLWFWYRYGKRYTLFRFTQKFTQVSMYWVLLFYLGRELVFFFSMFFSWFRDRIRFFRFGLGSTSFIMVVVGRCFKVVVGQESEGEWLQFRVLVFYREFLVFYFSIWVKSQRQQIWRASSWIVNVLFVEASSIF